MRTKRPHWRAKENSRRNRDCRRNESETEALHQSNERNASAKNLTEAESGARRQVVELAARDGTITKLKEQLDKVTSDSIKESTTIEDLHGDSSKKAAKIEDLSNQRTRLRNRMDEQAALLQIAVEERDSEFDNLRALLSISTEDISALEENLSQSPNERERLQLRYNKVGLALTTTPEELEEARTVTITRQIAVLIEDQDLRRQELDLLRRQLETSTTSTLEAQSRLQSYGDRTGRSSLTPAAPISTPLSQPTATPTSGVVTLPLLDPLSFEYTGSSNERPDRSRRSRDRDDFSEDRPHRSSGSR